MLALTASWVFIERGFDENSDFINNLPETSYRFAMFRSLIIFAAIALVYLLIKNRLQNRHSKQAKPSPHSPEDTVQCVECETYLPYNEAIFSEKTAFCCKQHQRDWHNKQE